MLGLGGRVSGEFQALDGSIFAEAIGVADLMPGNLRFRRSPVYPPDGGGDVNLVKLPAGSRLEFGFSDRPIVIQEEHHGAIQLETLQRAMLSPWSGFQGRIDVLGSGVSTGTIEIADPDAVGGLEGGTITFESSFSGEITVDRMQTFTYLPGTGDISSDPAIVVRNTMSGTIQVGRMDPVVPPTHPTNPLIEVGNLLGTIRIMDDQLGEIVVNATGFSTGSILVDGSIEGEVTIQGDFGLGGIGVIKSDADSFNGGAIDGVVRVAGMFDGEICGSNLAPFTPLPPNILICEVGPSATLCGAPMTATVFGDIAPPGGDGLVNLDDILCVLGGFGNASSCPAADLRPCGAADGVIGLDDILTILAAFAGSNVCLPGCE
jgi:hypothetical protein